MIPTDKVEVGFKDIDAAILVGSMPRKEGMERKDLLKANVAIFKTQGAALDKYAKKSVKVTRHVFTQLGAGGLSQWNSSGVPVVSTPSGEEVKVLIQCVCFCKSQMLRSKFLCVFVEQRSVSLKLAGGP